MAASPSAITVRRVRLLAVVAVLAFGGLGEPGRCARLLAVESMGGKSHWNFMSGVIRALLDKGHSVTAFTPFADGVNGENYTWVNTSDDMEILMAMNVKELIRQWSNPINIIGELVKLSRDFCDKIYENDAMKTALTSSDFDAVLVEPCLSDCVSHMARRLNLPLIYIMPVASIDLTKRHFNGHFSNPAIESSLFANHAVPETFYQRFTNALTLAYLSMAKEYSDSLLKLTEPKFYDRSIPVQPSLLFINSDFTSTSPVSNPANVIRIGGVHLNEPAKKLPEDILEFIEQSPHGVIYFTFGSTVKMSSLPGHVEKAFVDAFKQIPERVLWKYEGNLKDKPKNVMTKKWLPQREILLHPKVKLFISHGGISGIYEAVDAGVPVLGFPLFGDQAKNIASLVHGGMAISMDLFSVSEDALLKNIVKLLSNEKYTENAKKASEIFNDRPLSPSESVVYWTEYVIRHKGAPHIKSPAWNVTWYQYYLLDVITTALIIFCVVTFAVYKMFVLLYTFALSYYRSRLVKSKPE